MGQPLKTMDTATLLQQHGWRLALVVSLLVWKIRASMESLPPSISSVSFANVVDLIVSLILANWLRMELQTAIMRKDLPPGDLGKPFVGDLFSMFAILSSIAKDRTEKFGKFFTINTINIMTVAGLEDDVGWILNLERKGDGEISWPPAISALLGKGAVANSVGKRHKALRRIFEGAFTPKATKDYLDVIDSTTQKILNEWSKPDADNTDPPFLSSEVFKMYALRLFFIAAFGEEGEPDLLDRLHDDFKTWIQGFGEIVALKIPGSRFAKAMEARERILDAMDDLIVKFKKENPPESERGKMTMMGRACYGVDEDGKPMEYEELKDNVLNLVFAGHDTTYASLGSAVHFLCINPDICSALREEVKTFKEPLDFDELKNAPILNAFIAESWRMEPPVSAGFRKLTKPVQYKDYKFPNGMPFVYHILLGSRNPEKYPEPEQFCIQRFLPSDHPLMQDSRLPENAGGCLSDYSNFKPSYPIFGGGTRSCLGKHFAKLEMCVLLTRMVQSYDIEEQNAKQVVFPVRGWATEFKLKPITH